MRVSLQPGYVIHRRPYRESSLLLELLTPDHGRVGTVARGYRGRRTAGRAWLEPFQAVTVSWSGGQELVNLTGVEPRGPSPSLSGPALLAGLYVNELVLRLVPRRDPHAGLFQAYGETLDALGRDSLEGALRRFEVRLLEALGYGLDLRGVDADGAPLVADAWYRYLPDEGPVAADPDHAAGLVRGASLMALAAGRLEDAATLRELKGMMRAILAHHLGGTPLQTRRLGASLARNQDDDGGP